MENVTINHEIIRELTLLLDNTAVESFAPVIIDDSSKTIDQEAILINLKTINARYDKKEAMTQIRALMEKYNVQIDELLELMHY
jgi:hypothetical protein